MFSVKLFRSKRFSGIRTLSQSLKVVGRPPLFNSLKARSYEMSWSKSGLKLRHGHVILFRYAFIMDFSGACGS